jgi:hypothetical protein
MASPVRVGIDTVLFETDAPEIVLSRDVVGAAYLCSLTALGRDGLHFLAVQISSERLASLRTGGIDLRSALLHPEIPTHYQGRMDGTDARTIHLEAIDDVPPEWLPDEGFLLSDFEEEVSEDEVVKEAMTKNAAVIVCRMNPPEARGTVPKVDVDRLAECLRSFQSLVRHATKHALSALSGSRRANYNEDAPVLQVFAFSPGSFNIHFESKHQADLLGSSIVGAAMQQVDELMALAAKSPDEALEGFKRNKGHVLAAYHNLMRFVGDEDSPFTYRWSEPSMSTTRGESVSPAAARAMIAILDTRDTLRVEERVFHGRFTSVNTDRRPLSWAARDDEAKSHHGFLIDEAGHSLEGVTIRTQRYRFACEERLEKPASGRSSLRLYLKAVMPA